MQEKSRIFTSWGNASALNKYAWVSFTVDMCLTIFFGRELLIVPIVVVAPSTPAYWSPPWFIDRSPDVPTRQGAEQDVQGHAAEGGWADFTCFQRGGDWRAAARQRWPQQHFPQIREVWSDRTSHVCNTIVIHSFIHSFIYLLRYSDCHEDFFCFILNVKFFSYPFCNE